MTEDNTADLFMKIDELVYKLEDEGYPFAAIIEEMHAYVELVEEYRL